MIIKIKINSLALIYTGVALLTSFSACKKKDIVPFPTNIVTDADKNVYTYVTIGDQTWMAQNLKTTTYNNGLKIRDAQTDTSWLNSNLNNRPDSGAYCWYNTHMGPDSLVTKYGRLYNFYAVNTGKLCPTDWHVATDVDWQILHDTLQNRGLNADALKDKTWANGTQNINKTGFSALPGGLRQSNNGVFAQLNALSIWWSSTLNGTMAIDRYLTRINDDINKEINVLKLAGLSIRCVKN